MTTRNYLGSTYEEIRDGLHTGISERTLKITEERERIAIIKRYNELRASFWKRFYFLFKGV